MVALLILTDKFHFHIYTVKLLLFTLGQSRQKYVH